MLLEFHDPDDATYGVSRIPQNAIWHGQDGNTLCEDTRKREEIAVFLVGRVRKPGFFYNNLPKSRVTIPLDLLTTEQKIAAHTLVNNPDLGNKGGCQF